MNKSLGLITLCLGSAAVGGFIAVRLLAHPNAPAVATSLSSPTGATTVSTPRDITGKPDHPTLAAGAAPQVPTLMETRDDYDFESLAGPSQELARRFNDERPDPAWFPGAIDTVRHELEGQSVYAQLSSIDVDCKRTLCRIQATLPFEALQAMGPKANFSWGTIVGDLLSASPWNAEFDNISDMESMDQSLGQAQFITYLHRRPQGTGANRRTTS